MPSEPYIGQIMPAAFGVVPRGWHLCDGSLLNIGQYQALFALFGNRYGGDGKTTFGLPDLRGRAILGAKTGGDVGAQNGATAVTLTNQQQPKHNHMLQASTTEGTGRGASPAGRLFGVSTTVGGELIFALAGSGEVPLAIGANVAPAGDGQPHNNMQPYLAINYLVALEGIYPSKS
jgi:microcystin-dependent protein